jgi:hypothetical protein
MRKFSLSAIVTALLLSSTSISWADNWAGVTYANPNLCPTPLTGCEFNPFGSTNYPTTAGAQVTPANSYVALFQQIQTPGGVTMDYAGAGVVSLSNFASSNSVVTLSSQFAAVSSQLAGVSSQLAGVSSQLTAVSSQLAKYNSQSNKGIAMAYAMAGVPDLRDDENIAFAGNWGTFQSQNGFAIGAAYRLADHVSANAGFAASADGQQYGGRVGFRIGW